MKKLLSLLVLTSVAAACAGNPPAWWNPNNRYGSADTTQRSSKAQATAPQAAVEETDESLEPLPDTTYEEVTLTPMPDEENENVTGASAAQKAQALPQPSVLN